MLIAQISDTHIDPENANGGERLAALERAVADINGLAPLPDAVVHTGDLAHNGSDAKYRQAKAVLDGLRCPFFPVAGNRDDAALLRQYFPAGRPLAPEAPFFQYAVEDFPVRLIVLDTRHAEQNQGDFCEERAAILAAALDAAPERPTALFMHHPPFEVVESTYPWQFVERDAIARLGAVLAGRQNVLRVFCGHAHRDARGEVAGVPAGSVPSLAVDLRLGDFAPGLETTPLYHLHRFNGTAFATDLRATLPIGQEKGAAAD